MINLYLCPVKTKKYTKMKTNKLTFVGLLAGLALTFSACVKDSYQHYVEVVSPQGGQGFIYADQTIDSVTFVTFDSYHYYPHSSNPSNFISVDEALASKKIMNNYWQGHYFTLPVFFKPNTTEDCRLGHVAIESKSEMDDWNATTYATYLQCTWHCIEKPAPRYKYNKENTMVNGCDHLMLDSALQVADTIRFYPYDKWTITSSNPDVIKPTTTAGGQFRNNRPVIIPCTVAKNLTKDTIRTTLTITSECGATTTINFKQAPQKQGK